MSKDDFDNTLLTVGHTVTKCESSSECASALANGHYDVVLADPSDAASLKASNAAGIIPVTLKPSKEDLGKLKSEYAAAFDASRDALRLLPLLSKVAKRAH